MWAIEDEKIDPDSLVGDISIVSANGQIVEHAVYLDDWYDSLIEGISALREGSFIESDLVSEPSHLSFKFHNGCVNIGYKGSYVNTSLEVLEVVVYQSGKKLVEFFRENNPSADMQPLKKLIEFLNKKS